MLTTATFAVVFVPVGHVKERYCSGHREVPPNVQHDGGIRPSSGKRCKGVEEGGAVVFVSPARRKRSVQQNGEKSAHEKSGRARG